MPVRARCLVALLVTLSSLACEDEGVSLDAGWGLDGGVSSDGRISIDSPVSFDAPTSIDAPVSIDLSPGDGPVEADVPCAQGRLNCNGTCIDPDNDRDHCGATACSDGGLGAVCDVNELCVGGACTLSCPSGLVKCGGVCIDPHTNRDHCGAMFGCGTDGGSAGVACQAGEVCSQGVCSLSCQTGFVNCSGSCTDPSSSRAHCGASGDCTNTGAGNSAGMACAPGNICADGSCVLSCPAGSAPCGGRCVDPRTDNAYCGASGDCTNLGAGNSAGTACGVGSPCVAGVCQVVCNGAQTSCNNACVDFTTDPNNCGGCSVNGDHDCNNNATGGTCRNFGFGFIRCGGATCNEGYASCDFDEQDGCESNIATDPKNCGGCQRACHHFAVATPSSPTCASSACTVTTCTSGFDNCDSDANNGCEANLHGDIDRCGNCATNCGANQVCASDACQPLSCSAAEASASTPGTQYIAGHWNLNGTVGAVADGTTVAATRGAANGTARNADGVGLAYVEGKLGQALSFDGTDYVDLGPSLGNFGTGTFSIAFWMKTSPAARYQWMITKRKINSHSNFWEFGVSPSGELRAAVDEDDRGKNYVDFTGRTAVNDGQWHHVVLTRLGVQLRLYVDGDLDGTAYGAGITNLDNEASLYLGGSASIDDERFRGEIDDLVIWSGYSVSWSDERLISCLGGR
jgi:hypothetical protein